MYKVGISARLCILLLFLSFLIVCTSACVKDNGDNADIPDSSIESLEKEAAELQGQDESMKEVKASDTVLSKEAEQEQLKRLEELEEKLLKQSKEMEKKIKELQQQGN